jgi:hypothetical protein
MREIGFATQKFSAKKQESQQPTAETPADTNTQPQTSSDNFDESVSLES